MPLHVGLWPYVEHHVDACRTDYFEAAFANARSVVEPSIMDQTLIPYDVSFHDASGSLLQLPQIFGQHRHVQPQGKSL